MTSTASYSGFSRAHRKTGRSSQALGVRKLRGRAAGRGKQGRYRVIYYLKRADGVIWMLTMYPENVTEDIPARILRQIREEIENG